MNDLIKQETEQLKGLEKSKEAARKAEADRIEAERINSLNKERRESILNLWQFLPEKNRNANFGTWEQTYWDDVVSDLHRSKADYDKEQAEIKAENERLRIEAEKAEKKRIADEKKQAAKLKAERDKAAAESKKQADILKAEQDKASAERLEQELKLKTEREAREKLEREAKEKADREAAELKKAAKAPDKEKLFSVATKLRNTKTTVKSPEAKKALEDAALILEKIAGVM